VYIAYIGTIIGFLFQLFILFIIFNICLIIYKTIQIGLDVSHTVVGGIANTMQKTVDGAKIGPFRLGPIKIPEIKFLGFLQGPTDDVKRADSKIPVKASDVIIDLIKSFFNNLLK
jgi:hypothetical protein